MAGGLQYLAVVVDPLEQLLGTVHHRTHLHTVSQSKQVRHSTTDLLVHCSLGDLTVNLEAGGEHQPDRLGVRQPSLHGMLQTGLKCYLPGEQPCSAVAAADCGPPPRSC